MHHQRLPSAPCTAADRRLEVGGTTHPVRGGQHRRWVRPRARSDPYADERRGSRGRRASACADGSRGSWPGAGCSAGTCACSREFSHWSIGWARGTRDLVFCLARLLRGHARAVHAASGRADRSHQRAAQRYVGRVWAVKCHGPPGRPGKPSGTGPSRARTPVPRTTPLARASGLPLADPSPPRASRSSPHQAVPGRCLWTLASWLVVTCG